jgi:hypothetical protein
MVMIQSRFLSTPTGLWASGPLPWRVSDVCGHAVASPSPPLPSQFTAASPCSSLRGIERSTSPKVNMRGGGAHVSVGRDDYHGRRRRGRRRRKGTGGVIGWVEEAALMVAVKNSVFAASVGCSSEGTRGDRRRSARPAAQRQDRRHCGFFLSRGRSEFLSDGRFLFHQHDVSIFGLGHRCWAGLIGWFSRTN